MDKFENKYRIPSSRLKNYDYGSPGFYFITICTKDREHFFGEIKNHVMIVSELGLIANAEWKKTLLIRPDMNLALGDFVAMPNHIHGIIMIGENIFNSKNVKNGDGYDNGRDVICRNAMHGVSTNGVSTNGVSTNDIPINDVPTNNVPTDNVPTNDVPADGVTTDIIDTDNINWYKTNTDGSIKKTKNKFGPQSKNLGSIIRGYKSSVTTYARKNNFEFEWQVSFHDHIIRNHDEYLRISKYIINNPANWKEDKFFNEGL